MNQGNKQGFLKQPKENRPTVIPSVFSLELYSYLNQLIQTRAGVWNPDSSFHVTYRQYRNLNHRLSIFKNTRLLWGSIRRDTAVGRRITWFAWFITRRSPVPVMMTLKHLGKWRERPGVWSDAWSAPGERSKRSAGGLNSTVTWGNSGLKGLLLGLNHLMLFLKTHMASLPKHLISQFYTSAGD